MNGARGECRNGAMYGARGKCRNGAMNGARGGMPEWRHEWRRGKMLWRFTNRPVENAGDAPWMKPMGLCGGGS
jgi:hypothetical protein